MSSVAHIRLAVDVVSPLGMFKCFFQSCLIAYVFGRCMEVLWRSPACFEYSRRTHNKDTEDTI